MKSYFLIEMIYDFESSANSREYNVGVRRIVWESEACSCYWVANPVRGMSDTIPKQYAKKIYKINFEEIS